MIRKLFSSQLRINMVSGVATAVLNVLVLAVAYPVYLRFLGYERYGVWLVLATVLSFAQLGNLGVGHAVMKLVAEEYGRRDFRAVQEYVVSATAVLAISGAVALAVIIVFRVQIVALFNLSEENSKTALWLLPYVGCLSVYVLIVQALNATLSGLGRMDLANYAQTGGRIVMVSVATFLLAQDRGIESLLLGSIASYLFVHVASVFLIRKEADIRVLRRSNLRLSRAKRLLSFGSGVFGGSILNMLLSPFNKLMLSRYAGVASIPVYEIAYRGSMQIRGLAEVSIRALMPEVSRLGANGTEQARTRIRTINRRAIGLLVCFAVPFYGVLLLFAPLLLQVWLGDRVVEVLPLALRIALCGSLLSLACVPAYYLLLGLGHVRDCFFNHALLSGINVLLVLIFAWTGDGLSLPEVLVSTLVGMGVSSAYIIMQSHRMLEHALPGTAVEQDQSKETQVCLSRASARV